MDAYWYIQGDARRGLKHVVFASSRAIANWYARTSPSLRNAYFICKENRKATELESTTCLAHAADKTLLICRDAWRANGGGSDYQTELDRLAKRIIQKEVN